MKTEMNGEQMKLGFYTEWLRALRQIFQFREREREGKRGFGGGGGV